MGYDILSNTNPEMQAINIANKPGSNLVEHYFRTMVSFSHVLGTVTTILVDYVRSAFNDKYFKTTWNSMEVPFSQRSKAFLDIMKKPRPMMLIDPRFDPSDEASFRPQVEFDEFVSNSPTQGLKLGMSMIDSRIVCQYKNFKLCYRPRKYKMNFNIHFVFDSDMQRVQCQQYIRQTIRHGNTNVLYRAIENVIPTEYIMEIARLNGFDYKSREFLDFLNTYTMYPITRRIRGSSGNIEFFWLVRTPVYISFGDQSSEGAIKKGTIEVSSSFSENIVVEFVSSSLYYLVTAMNKGDPLYKDTITVPEKRVEDEAEITHIGLSVLNILDIPEIDENNFVKYFSMTIQADKNGDDTVDILPYLDNSDVYHVYKFCLEKSIPIDFFNVKVIEDYEYMDKSKYEFDVNTFNLTIKDMDVYKSYHVILYADNKTIGNILNKYFETDKAHHGKDEWK